MFSWLSSTPPPLWPHAILHAIEANAEQIILVSIDFYGETRFDMQMLSIASILLERIMLVIQDSTVYTYSGAKKYLVSHQLCKFSHLKRWEACNCHHMYTSKDKMWKQIQAITLSDLERIYLQIMVENKYLVTYKQARFLALTDMFLP